MSERFNVDMDDVLGSNYFVTSISASDYNPTIDGTVTLTVTLKDVYGDVVSGEEVTVTCSAGTFTGLNGSTITGTTSVTGTTNASGQFTLTYSCTVWGLITILAGNSSTQIKVGGWKTITLTNGTLYVNGETRVCELHYSKTNVAFSSADTWTFVETVSQIANYPPVDNNNYYINANPNILTRVYASGSIQARSTVTSGGATVQFNAMWHY